MADKPAAMPVRMRLSRAKGFDLQAASRALNGLPAVKVDRSTRWGNPFRIVPRGSPRWWDVVGEHLIPEQCSFRTEAGARMAAARFFELSTPIGKTVSVYPLRGRNLACWCPPAAPGEPDHCHAAILLRLANPPRCDTPTTETGQGAPAGQGGARR